MNRKAKRLLTVSLVSLALCVPGAAMSGRARAANGKCQYGQKSDGSCWDAQASARGGGEGIAFDRARGAGNNGRRM